MKILMVLTSHDELGDTGEKTGFWLEELAAPYYAFKDGGAKLTLASQASRTRAAMATFLGPARRLRAYSTRSRSALDRTNFGLYLARFSL